MLTVYVSHNKEGSLRYRLTCEKWYSLLQVTSPAPASGVSRGGPVPYQRSLVPKQYNNISQILYNRAISNSNKAVTLIKEAV